MSASGSASEYCKRLEFLQLDFGDLEGGLLGTTAAVRFPNDFLMVQIFLIFIPQIGEMIQSDEHNFSNELNMLNPPN